MKIHVAWVVMISLIAGVGGGFAGFKFASSDEEPEAVPPAIKPPVKLVSVAPEKKADEFEAPPTLTDEDIENLIADAEDEPEIDEEERKRWEERSRRFANMSTEQRRMWRKSFFTALAEVDGLEEVEDAVKAGKLDPKVFEIDNVEDIADRLEFYTETMDEDAIKGEVTKTLEGIVNDANAELKSKESE